MIRSTAAHAFVFALIQSSDCDQGVYKPKDNLTVPVWTGSDLPQFQYPELSDGDYGMPSLLSKPSVGIAVSGGGYRATTLALGWVRGLYLLGAVAKSRYLSSNSGGSWFNGAFSYTQQPWSIFLGPYIPPENLTIAQATADASTPMSYAHTIQKATIVGEALIGVVVDALTPNLGKIGAWSDNVGEAFLMPHGVGAQSSSVTALGTRGKVHEKVAATYPGVPFITACATPDRPFPIILGSIIEKQSQQRFFPVEFTPLYIGAPGPHSNSSPIIGGGFVAPLGFNSKPPGMGPAATASMDGSSTVNVDPVYVVPLTTMVGVSSSFVAQGMAPTANRVVAQDLTGTEQLYYWNNFDYQGAQLGFADGGGVDNLAIIPLLRRKVRTIIVGTATVVPPNTNATDWAVGQWDVAGLFGAVPREPFNRTGKVNGQPVDAFNKFMQVFPREGYQELYDAMQAAYRAGTNTLYRARWQVLDNVAQDVHGGWTVDILWFMNNQIDAWENALPAETLKLITDNRSRNATKQSRDAGLREYPYVSTLNADYSPKLVSLLSQQATWQVMQAADAVRALLAGAGASAAANATAGAASGGSVAGNATAGAASGVLAAGNATLAAGT